MSQLEMFGGEVSTAGMAKRVAWVHPQYAPFPDALRRRLETDLRHLQSAEFRPWPEWRVDGEIDQFLACVDRLPPDRRGDLIERFETELQRLGLR